MWSRAAVGPGARDGALAGDVSTVLGVVAVSAARKLAERVRAAESGVVPGV